MRALLLIFDGLGIGDAPDAERFHPPGANTLGNLMLERPGLSLPTLTTMGLLEALHSRIFDPPARATSACYGRMRPRAPGNDSTSGHWELAGAITEEPFAIFESFPEELVKAIEADAGVSFLGNVRLSPSHAMERYAREHLESRQPVLFTSASSALQIAAHESVIPLPELYKIGQVARRHADAWRIARVIVKPFRGGDGEWLEAPGRHDFTLPPPRTVLNAVADAGLPVVALGKIGDLFGYSGITRSFPTDSDDETLELLSRFWNSPKDALVVANLSDSDTHYGHRRDPAGFARSLARFDQWLAEFVELLDEDDLLIITADHGNDPTFSGTDHTREEVPVLIRYDGRTGPLGLRKSFADVAATLADYFHPILSESETIAGTPLITFHRPPPGFAPH